MRLRELAVKNLFQYADAAVTFDPAKPIALFFGQNGSGKSNLKHLIEILLAADVQDIDGTSVKLERLRKTGADKGAVQGVFTRPVKEGQAVKEDLTVKRTVTGKGITTRVNGHESAGDISEYLGTVAAPDLLYRALANVTGYFRLKAVDQKALLMSLISQDVPAGAFKGTPGIDERLVLPTTFKGIDESYLKFVEQRKTKKADLARVPAAGSNEILNRFPSDIAAIDKRLASIEGEKDALLKESGEVIGQARLLEQQIETYTGAVAEADFELAAFPSTEHLVTEAQRLDAEYTEVDAKAGAWKTGNDRITDEGRKRQALANAGLKLDGVAGLCVIGGDIICPMTPENKAAASASLGARVDVLTESIEATKREIGAAPDIAGARKALQEARESVKERAGWQKKRDDASTGLATATEKIGVVKAQAEAAEKALATLRGRIEKGKETRALAITFNRERADAIEAKARRELLAVEVEGLEKLVAAFGPKGVKERLLIERVQNLVKGINATLAAFGLAMEFTDDPFEVRVNGAPAALMAESEQFRAGVAFQIALAAATGVRFVVIDGADILDGPNRRALWTVLQAATAGALVDQVVVTATYSTEEPPRTAPPGVQSFHIVRGEAGSTIVPLIA